MIEIVIDINNLDAQGLGEDWISMCESFRHTTGVALYFYRRRRLNTRLLVTTLE